MILDSETFNGRCVEWVQALANGDPTDPTLELDGDELVPTGGEWQAGAHVDVVRVGGNYEVAAYYDGVNTFIVVQPTDR